MPASIPSSAPFNPAQPAPPPPCQCSLSTFSEGEGLVLGSTSAFLPTPPWNCPGSKFFGAQNRLPWCQMENGYLSSLPQPVQTGSILTLNVIMQGTQAARRTGWGDHTQDCMGRGDSGVSLGQASLTAPLGFGCSPFPVVLGSVWPRAVLWGEGSSFCAFICLFASAALDLGSLSGLPFYHCTIYTPGHLGTCFASLPA